MEMAQISQTVGTLLQDPERQILGSYVMNEVAFGWLIRGMHHWGATLMVAIVFLHMLRVFFYGASKVRASEAGEDDAMTMSTTYKGTDIAGGHVSTPDTSA